MSNEVNKTTIKTYQGDTCFITLTDLDVGAHIFFSVRDKKTNELVFNELNGYVDNEGYITFEITPEMSNKFKVCPYEGKNSYLYGAKQVDDITGEENTILLGDNPVFGDKYIMEVYIKKSEGIVE